VAALRSRWQQSLSVIKGIQILDFSEVVEQIGTAAAANPAGEQIARPPYSAEVYSALGTAIARQVRCRRIAPAKVLALDGDGVLWGKIPGEDGFDGICPGPDEAGRPFLAFQQSILRLRSRGVLLVIVSRNELAYVQRLSNDSGASTHLGQQRQMHSEQP